MSMAQIKIYGLKAALNPIKKSLSEVIHDCMVQSLKLPVDKKFHRYFPIDKEDFYFPNDKSESYTIVEISMFQGRTVEAKKQLITQLFQTIKSEVGISPEDLEITIFETPMYHWGIRGLPGDELKLNYVVDV
ncbi:4-oxalocrotonate tautomerase [Bacillus sp. TS-2]|nr:4-oxalocrotonate tautomerase [Bacillus sp. TS-2]